MYSFRSEIEVLNGIGRKFNVNFITFAMPRSHPGPEFSCVRKQAMNVALSARKHLASALILCAPTHRHHDRLMTVSTVLWMWCMQILIRWECCNANDRNITWTQRHFSMRHNPFATTDRDVTGSDLFQRVGTGVRRNLLVYVSQTISWSVPWTELPLNGTAVTLRENFVVVFEIFRSAGIEYKLQQLLKSQHVLHTGSLLLYYNCICNPTQWIAERHACDGGCSQLVRSLVRSPVCFHHYVHVRVCMLFDCVFTTITTQIW